MPKKTNFNFYDAAVLLLACSFVLPRQFSAIAVIILVIAFFVSGKPFVSNQWKNNPVNLFFIGFYLLHLAGILWSEFQEIGLKELEYKLAYLILPLAIGASDRFGETQAKLAGRGFYLAAAALMLTAFGLAFSKWMVAEQKSVDYFVYENLANPFGFQPIYMALYMVFAFYLLWFDNLLSNHLKQGNVIKLCLLGVFFIGIIMLASRMEILVFWAVLPLVLVYKAFTEKKIAKPLGILVVFAVATFGLIAISPTNAARFQEASAKDKHYSEEQWGGKSVRLEKWKNTAEIIKENFFFGVGTGDLKAELHKTYEKNEFFLGIEHNFNPHNQYLQTWATLGLLGLLFMVAPWIFILLKGLQYKDPVPVCFVLVITLSMVTESMLERQWGLLFILFFTAVYGKILHQKQYNVKPTN
ncbi:MAG: O-antigen ligase family protein [Luteibaculaceae bacterium]